VGETLPCETGTWEYNPSFSYRWLRNGVAISGAEASEYTLTTADRGDAIQCEVIGTRSAGSVVTTSGAVTVSPVLPTALPVLSSEVHVLGESGTVAVGSNQSCMPGEWSGSPALSYQWLRNDAPIAGAESATYEVVEADRGTSLQCRVTATNPAGSVAAENRYFTMVEPSPGEPPYVEVGHPGPAIPVHPVNEARGPVTVADQLPPGLALAPHALLDEGAGPEAGKSRVSGIGWSCEAPTAYAFTCTRSDGLAPEEAYPSITASVHVAADAADSIRNAATVGGGGANSATAAVPTMIATVPFGISSLRTSVTNDALTAFTQGGGHPFAANSTFVLNYVPSDVAGGGLLPAGGTAPHGQTL
jgi:hypothetical protein